MATGTVGECGIAALHAFKAANLDSYVTKLSRAEAQ
jgi:hypothetical protein